MNNPCLTAKVKASISYATATEKDFSTVYVNSALPRDMRRRE